MEASQTENNGTIVALSISRARGTKKYNVDAATLIGSLGLAGDAHAGRWHRQVSLLAEESIAKVRARGLDVAPGDFAENITTRGIRLWELEEGARLKLGEHAVLEVTQVGKRCHTRCEIYHRLGDCVMPKEGLFARVLSGGEVRPGSPIRVIRRAEE